MKKEGQAVIEKVQLGIHDSPPSYTLKVLTPHKNTSLDMLSAVSKSFANKSKVDY